MSDYISREAAEKAAIDAADEWDGGCNLNRWRIIKKGIRAIPAAAVRENVNARWIDMGDHLLCSGCGATHYGADKNFCPSCGADMREEDGRG